MKTLTHKRPTVSAEKTIGFEKMLEKMALRNNLEATLSNILLNIITFFIEDDMSEENWALLTSRYQFKNMDLKFLMDLTFLVLGNAKDHILIDGILGSDKLYFPEFTKILENVQKSTSINLYTVDMVINKIKDVGIYHNQVEEGDLLIVKFMNAIITFLNRNNNLDALQEIADTYEWNQFDIKLLRVIALWACDHEECGYTILQKIIEAKKLHLCDLTKIAKTAQHSRIKWVLRYAIQEASEVSGCEQYGQEVINTMLPPKPQGAVNSLTACEKLGCENCGLSTNNIYGSHVCRLVQ